MLHYKEGKCYLLDIGESSQMKKGIEEHDRKEWEKNAQGEIDYSVYYTPDLKKAGRKEIEAEIRATFRPPCGKN